jgi:hypothetical protein
LVYRPGPSDLSTAFVRKMSCPAEKSISLDGTRVSEPPRRTQATFLGRSPQHRWEDSCRLGVVNAPPEPERPSSSARGDRDHDVFIASTSQACGFEHSPPLTFGSAASTLAASCRTSAAQSRLFGSPARRLSRPRAAGGSDDRSDRADSPTSQGYSPAGAQPRASEFWGTAD